MRLDGKDADITMAPGADGGVHDGSLLGRISAQAERAKASARSNPWVTRITATACTLIAVAMIDRCLPEEEFNVADKIIYALKTNDNSCLADPKVGIPDNLNEAQVKVLIDLLTQTKKETLRLAEKAGYLKDDLPPDYRTYDMFIRVLKQNLRNSELPINMREEMVVLSMWQSGAEQSNADPERSPQPTRITHF